MRSRSGGVVRVWALSGTASTVVRSWNGPANVDCHHLGFDGAGDFLVASYDHGEAQIFGLEDPPGADPLRIVDGTGGRAVQSAFHPGNRCLVTVSLGRIAVWPLVRSRYPYVLRGHEGHVGAVEFGPGGEFLVSSASDGTVRYWPLKTGPGAEPRILHDWGSPVETLTDWMDLSEDGRVVVATGDRDFVRVIPLDGRPSRDLLRADQRLGRAAVSADGRRVATLGRFDGQNEVRIWDLESDMVESLVLDDDTGWLRLWSSLEFSRDGQLFWSLDHQVWKWNPKTGDSSVVLPEGPRHFRISGDGRSLIGHSAIGGAGFELTGVFDLEDGSSIRLSGHGVTVRGFALDSTGSVAVTGDLSGCIRVGSAAGGPPHLLTADASLVTAVDISPDGRWIASGHLTRRSVDRQRAFRRRHPALAHTRPRQAPARGSSPRRAPCPAQVPDQPAGDHRSRAPGPFPRARDRTLRGLGDRPGVVRVSGDDLA